MKIIFPAIFSKMASRADKTFKIEFDTRELGEQAAELMGLLQTEGWCLFSPNDDLEVADIPDEKADSMTGQKTQAQRLRAVIYLLWEQRGKKGSSEDFYRSYMEQIIDQIKEKLS